MIKKRHLLILILLNTPWLFAQNSSEKGYPLINNYSPKEYGADTQNWAILQDDRGVMYFGNNLGLLEFDGADWRLYKMPNGSTVRSLAQGKNGKIYAGGVGDLGYFQSDNLGRLIFHSLLSFIPEDKRDFSDVWSTYIHEDRIYYRVNSYVLIWDIKNQRFNVIQGEGDFHLGFLVNGKYYVREWGKGLNFVENDSLILLKGSEQFANERIYVMIPFPDEKDTALLVTRTMGMFKFDGKNFIPFKTEVDDFIKENLIYAPGCILYDGNILLGTLNDGAVVIDRNGKEVKKYNRDSGVISTVIYTQFQDRSGGIWLPTDNGISRIDYASQVSYFDSRNNFSTTAYQIIRHKGIIYAATNNGVYYFDEKTSNFQQIKQLNNQAFTFYEDGNDLLVGTGLGLYKVDLENPTAVRPGIGNEYSVSTIVKSKSDPNRIYVAVYGLASMIKKNGKWIDEGKILDINDNANSLEEEKNGTIWLGTNSFGVYRITLQKDDKGNITFENPKVENFNSSHGLPESYLFVKRLNGENYFLSGNNFYRFDEQSETFFLDNRYKVVSSLFGYISPTNIKEDNLRRLWISLGREPAMGNPQPDGTYQWLTAPFSRFSNEIIVSIYPENNGTVWFSASSSIIKYDLTQNNFYNSDYSVLIRNVSIGEDSVIYYGGKLDKPLSPEIEYDYNSIKFSFAAPSFEDETANQYKTYLEGFDNGWSTFGKENKKEFTNLSPGEYTFNVIAKNVFEIESQPASFSFVIHAPWYRSWTAYIVYAVLLALLIFVVDRIQRKKIIQKGKEKLRVQEAEHRAETAELQAKVAQSENERKSKELEEARQLQLSMLPMELPRVPNLDIAVYMQTATEVGGDYYDFHVSLNGTLTVVIGDATGHGMKAGTMVTTVKSLFNSYAPNPDILFSFQEITRCIKQMNFEKLSMCMTMLKIQGNEIKMSTAGMPPTFIYRRDTQSTEEHLLKGMPLGTMDKFPYEIKDTTLKPGDTILLITDGLPELKNNSEEMYGYKRVRNTFEEVAEKAPEEIITHLKDEGSTWVNDHDPDDDVTFVVIKVK